jgi:hypothetical protein
MPLEMLGLPTLLGGKARLPSVVTCNSLFKNLGNHTQEGFNLNNNEFHLKHTCSSILYYNKIEQDPRTLQLSNFENNKA